MALNKISFLPWSDYMKSKVWIIFLIILAFFVACGGGKKKASNEKKEPASTENKSEYQHIVVGSNGQLLAVPKYPKHEADYNIIMVGPDKNLTVVPATECPHCLRPQSAYINIIR